MEMLKPFKLTPCSLNIQNVPLLLPWPISRADAFFATVDVICKLFEIAWNQHDEKKTKTSIECITIRRRKFKVTHVGV